MFKWRRVFISIYKLVMNLKEENSLIAGTVANFNVMPKQAFEEEDIIIISKYIFNNEIEKPDWF